MKKLNLLMIIVFVFQGFFTSCTSTPLSQNNDAEITQEPQDPPNVLFVKQLQDKLNENDLSGAIEHFQSIPDELKDDMDLKLLLASLYISSGDLNNSEKVANEILAQNPENLDALELLSITYRAKNDNAKYKSILKQILVVDPYNASANIIQAEDYALNKKYKLSRDSYRKALRSEPDNLDALFGYAQMSYYLDDIDSAKTYFETILQIDSYHAPSLAYMGKLSAEDMNYLRATKYIQDAIKIDPTNYDYYLDLGNYYRNQGKYSDAIDAWNKATELEPTYFLAYAYLAGCYDEQNEFDLALENYHKVIQTNPKYYYAYEAAGILEYKNKNFAVARQMFDKAYEYNKNFSYPLLNAAMYLQEKDTFNAKKILAALMKTMDKNSTEFNLVRFYHDSYSRNAESLLISKISKEDNSNKRGKLYFYMGLYNEINGSDTLAKEFYVKVTNMQAPMFFEYRLAEWGIEK